MISGLQVKGLVLSQAREAASQGLSEMKSLTAQLSERDGRLSAFCHYMVSSPCCLQDILSCRQAYPIAC